MRVAPVVTLSDEQKRTLTGLAASRTQSVRVAQRARIILLAAHGREDQEIAAALGCGRHAVARWRKRFLDHGITGLLKDRPRGGRPARTEVAQEIVRLTTQELPEEATHWSSPLMARRVGCSGSTVLRVWRAHGLKPHRLRSFKVSTDPLFAQKLEDVVGLYLHPPAHALVCWVCSSLCKNRRSLLRNCSGGARLRSG